MFIRRSRLRRLFGSSTGLFAAFHVLHRLLAPRHPPCALSSLTTSIPSSRIYPPFGQQNDRTNPCGTEDSTAPISRALRHLQTLTKEVPATPRERLFFVPKAISAVRSALVPANRLENVRTNSLLVSCPLPNCQRTKRQPEPPVGCSSFRGRPGMTNPGGGRRYDFS